jgi:uncharacterized protein DUF6642
MKRAKTRLKNIACLEGHWDGDLARPLSVRPILETTASMHRVQFAHLSCNTEPELNYNLSLLKRRPSFQILYLAFHGSPGVLELPRGNVSLEKLAAKLGAGFAGRVIHLGTCQTIDVPRRRVREFLDRTGVALLLGYRHDVDWMEAAGTELLLLHRLQHYRNLGAFWSDFTANYRDLIRLTGLCGVQA